MAQGGVPKLSSQVELRLSCVGLPNLDILSKSDCFVVVYIKADGPPGSTLNPSGVSDPTKQQWFEIKRTSTIRNSLNPEWPDQILLEYHFELVQELRFDVYDRDGESPDLSTHDYVGTVITPLSRIMGSRGAVYSAFLENRKRGPQNSGRLIIKGEEAGACKDILYLQLQGHKLERKNMLGLGRSDPFYTISKSREDGSFVKVWQSEAIKANVNPLWKTAEIPVQTICNCDYDRPIRIDVYDWESDGDHKIIGGFTTSLRSLQPSREYALINDAQKKKKGDKYKNSGMVIVKVVNVLARYSFLDYVRGGCELNLIVAIDFTASNGTPTSPQSLHYQHPNFNFDANSRTAIALNEYQQAIISIGQILQDYDSDALFPLYGFGGVVNGETNHCFPLTFNYQNPQVHGVQGILDAYKNAFNFVTLSGPTLFAGILRMANGYAAQSVQQGQQKYTILLILTDGVINDMEATIAELVEGSYLPLSVVIVGVGNADFANMRVLDADGSTLFHNGKPMKRDIVQFVPFRKFYNMHYTALAAETLAEIPDQLVGFMQSRGIKPNPPIQVTGSSFQHAGAPQATGTFSGTMPYNQPAQGGVAPPQPGPPRGYQF